MGSAESISNRTLTPQKVSKSVAFPAMVCNNILGQQVQLPQALRDRVSLVIVMHRRSGEVRRQGKGISESPKTRGPTPPHTPPANGGGM